MFVPHEKEGWLKFEIFWTQNPKTAFIILGRWTCVIVCARGEGGSWNGTATFLYSAFFSGLHFRLSFPILTKFYCIVVNVAISSNVKVRNEGTTKIKISSEEKTMEKTVLLKPSTLDCVTDSSNLPKSSICDIAAVIWTIFLNFGEFPKKVSFYLRWYRSHMDCTYSADPIPPLNHFHHCSD